MSSNPSSSVAAVTSTRETKGGRARGTWGKVHTHIHHGHKPASFSVCSMTSSSILFPLTPLVECHRQGRGSREGGNLALYSQTAYEFQ